MSARQSGRKDLIYDDSAIVSLMREALTRSMAEAANLRTDGRHELWKAEPAKTSGGPVTSRMIRCTSTFGGSAARSIWC